MSFITTLQGLHMPRMLYGTAWKKERTTDCVVRAVLAGFRGIDTACQPKHYQENLVGDALAVLERDHNITRQSLFLQTKFTSLDGQDPARVPYDPHAQLPDQVKQSISKSMQNLGVKSINSLVLHSPMRTHDATMTVWREFEHSVAGGHVQQLGISNIYSLHALEKIWAEATIKPAVIQNRFYADTGYDTAIRTFCRHHQIVYQSFWTLTGNPSVIHSALVRGIAAKRQCTPEQVFYRFVLDLGIVPLNGTTSDAHMAQDLQAAASEPLAAQERADICALMRIDR